jgi:hypothetical protein
MTDPGDAPDIWGAIEARLDDGPAVILPVPHERDREQAVRSRRRRAAALVAVATLVTAGVAAAAVTLTPLRTFFRGAPQGAPEDALAASPSEAGVELEIPAGGLTVELDAPDGLRLVIVLWDGERIALTAASESAALTFRSGAGRLLVTGGEGTLQVRAPVRSSPIRIVSRGVTIAVVRDGAIRSVGREAATALDASLGALREASARRDPP